jgi:hypothetical protein
MVPMEPAFERISRIGKIRIVHEGGETIGELIPSQRPQQKLFGEPNNFINVMVLCFATTGCAQLPLKRRSNSERIMF